MEVIARISEGVTKDDWKQLIHYKGSTEKELENIIPSSISSMQKKTVYGKETSERIYELAKLFGLGYEVFDSKEDFMKWLKTMPLEFSTMFMAAISTENFSSLKLHLACSSYYFVCCDRIPKGSVPPPGVGFY
ncbi:hypothetical protein [Membranihabitans maritimus]|uniref:hypothetical protein n=1 Tax=Membranihabitans maritimus TaxID=2904244 RepID=UPI001F4653CF|nr:hypothetical protein [Membranihabitans maritimus]